MRSKNKKPDVCRYGAAALALVSAAMLAGMACWGPRTQRAARRPAALPAQETGGKRPVFPYSVVPGGVYTARELGESAARDQVVAAHYAGLHTTRLQPALLEQDRRAYVSYRKHDTVFWTRRTVRIPRGEQVLSDGDNLVRARCGNRISDVPRTPTLADEPPEITGDSGRADRSTPPAQLSGQLDPGRSLSILDLEPGVLPHELALALPQRPGAAAPSFSALEPMPFMGHPSAAAGPPALRQNSGTTPPAPVEEPVPLPPPSYAHLEPPPLYYAPRGIEPEPPAAQRAVIPGGPVTGSPFYSEMQQRPPSSPGTPSTPGTPGAPGNPGTPENPGTIPPGSTEPPEEPQTPPKWPQTPPEQPFTPPLIPGGPLPEPVPEPHSLTLFAIGLTALALAGRGRRR